MAGHCNRKKRKENLENKMKTGHCNKKREKEKK